MESTEKCGPVKICSVVFCLHFKKARRLGNYTWNCLNALSNLTRLSLFNCRIGAGVGSGAKYFIATA
jgi:hypothetical protein